MMKVFFALVVSILLAAAPVLANSSLSFGGVGIDGVPRGDGMIVVRQLVTGGPAHVAGIRNGDIIMQIDGTATSGSNFREMVDHRLRGRAGTPVVLKVKRSGNPKPLTFKLIRHQLALSAARKK
jgi:C-terminal processing protease CtpA/Prc